jgi:hypothetical protein
MMMDVSVCYHCGGTYVRKIYYQRYCSQACRESFHLSARRRVADEMRAERDAEKRREEW